MKLILFALMARGVGIVASIIGIFLVKGKNDEKMDPLKPITRGFWLSAGVAVIGTGILSFYMMSGIQAISWKDDTGEQVTGVTTVRLKDMRWMHAVKQAEAGVETPNAPAPETKPTLTDAELLERTNKYMVDLVAMVNRNLAPEATKTEDPAPITAAELAEYRSNPLADYTMVEQGQPRGSIVAIAGQTFDDTFYLAQYEQQFMDDQGKPQGEPMKQWALLPQSVVDKPQDGMKILDKVEAPFGLTKDGELYWAIDRKIEDKDALAALVRFDYSKTEIEPPKDFTQPPPRATSDGTVVPIQKETTPVEWWRFFAAIVFGIVMAYVIERLTDYFVSFEKKPVREIAMASTAGPAPMIIQGFAYAMESAVWSVLTIVVALLGPLFLFPPAMYGGTILSFYGIALVGLGLLTTTGYILAMDTFGPISDNAQGVYEMSGAKETETVQEGSMAGSRAVQRLDAAGNTTKALTKGFAIATAVVAAVALFHSFIEDAHLTAAGLRLETPQIFIGLLIGGAAPFLFSAFSINAVGRAAFQLIGEVRRQFAADPGIMAGTSKPNYGKCVAIVTSAAQKELLGPGILAIAFPILVGFGLAIGGETTMIGGVELNLVGAQALGGFLAGAILSGQLLAVTLANSGGAWDNSKKLIEDGMYGGKGSEAHKAGVVCDTVGDPFKDTAGPALNPLIKVMNLVALLLAPLVIMPMAMWVRVTIVVATVIALAIAVFWSKRGSMGSELAKTGEA
jgi:K(+)-stimulated pyrophosphate-energized sodium pump